LCSRVLAFVAVLFQSTCPAQIYSVSIASSDWKLSNGKEKTNGVASYINGIRHKVVNVIRPGSTPKYGLVSVQPNGKQLQDIVDLVSNGTLKTVVDRRFPLSEAVAAFEYLESGHATGKVVVYMDEE